METFTLQEYETELNFTFIRAGKICSGMPSDPEASGLSSLNRKVLIFLLPASPLFMAGCSQKDCTLLPLGTGQVRLAFR